MIPLLVFAAMAIQDTAAAMKIRYLNGERPKAFRAGLAEAVNDVGGALSLGVGGASVLRYGLSALTVEILGALAAAAVVGTLLGFRLSTPNQKGTVVSNLFESILKRVNPQRVISDVEAAAHSKVAEVFGTLVNDLAPLLPMGADAEQVVAKVDEAMHWAHSAITAAAPDTPAPAPAAGPAPAPAPAPAPEPAPAPAAAPASAPAPVSPAPTDPPAPPAA